MSAHFSLVALNWTRRTIENYNGHTAEHHVFSNVRRFGKCEGNDDGDGWEEKKPKKPWLLKHILQCNIVWHRCAHSTRPSPFCGPHDMRRFCCSPTFIYVKSKQNGRRVTKVTVAAGWCHVNYGKSNRSRSIPTDSNCTLYLCMYDIGIVAMANRYFHSSHTKSRQVSNCLRFWKEHIVASVVMRSPRVYVTETFFIVAEKIISNSGRTALNPNVIQRGDHDRERKYHRKPQDRYCFE